MKKENKDTRMTVRLNPTQTQAVDKLVADGTCKTQSAALQYIVNMAIIKGII